MSTVVDPMSAERQRMRAVEFAEALRRIADAITHGYLPAPSTPVELSWYLHGDSDDQRRRALEFARVLGGDWRAHPYMTNATGYAGTQSIVAPGLSTAIILDNGEPEPPPVSPAVELAAALNSAVEGLRQQRIAAQGEPITREQLAEVAPTLAGRDDDYSPEGIDRDTEGEATP